MRRVVFACALAGVLTAALVAMVDYVGIDTIQRYIPFATLPLVLAALGAFFVAVVSLTCWGMPRVPRMLVRSETWNPLPVLPIVFTRKSILVCACVILICWLPYIVLQFPCAMFRDTYDQLYQFQTHAPTLYVFLGEYTNAEFVDHHPVFDSLLFGSFLWFGDRVGSQNAGLFLYSILQCVLTAGALSLSCCYLQRLKVPKTYRLLSLFFVSLFPIIPLWATCMAKDSLFSAVFLLFFIMFIEMWITKGEALASSKFMVVFVVVAGLCILTKKTGVYLVALPMIVLLIAHRHHWETVVAATMAPVALFFIFVPAVLYPLIGGVEPGGKQEMLGALYQQTITVLREEDNDVTEEERSAIDGVLYSDLAALSYQGILVDNVKNNTRINLSTSDYVRFFQAYLSIGIRHPLEYARSIGNVCAPLLAPGVGMTFSNTPETDDEWKQVFASAKNGDQINFTFYKPEPLKTWAQEVQDGYVGLIENNPAAAILLGRGMFGGWIPLCCIFLAACNNRRYWIVFAPIMLSIAVLVVSPAGSTRYMLPMLYATPLMLGLLYRSFPSPAGILR